MSFIYKCDVCGKDSAMTGVRFTPEEMELDIDTYNGSKMKVKLNIVVEDLIDSENVQKMEIMLNSLINKRMMPDGDDVNINPTNTGEESMDNHQLYQETLYENIDKFMEVFKDKLVFMGDGVGLKLNTPNAMICDTCKRELAYRVLTESTYKPKTDVFSYLYATDSIRVPPLENTTGNLELEEGDETAQLVVIKRGSWYELPDGTRVRRKDLPENVIIKTEKDDKE